MSLIWVQLLFLLVIMAPLTMREDTIDVSNLNRQFLFRQSDVGKSKAEVAAKFVSRRVKGVKITPYNGKIQDKDEDYYMQFQVIVCGLDSIEARRWINAMLVGMVDWENSDSLKPMVDGGTEGFKGQARVIYPMVGPCFECQLDMHAPRAAVPLCTIATIPRQPQHCIEWANIIAWPEQRPGETVDTDDPKHISWLFQTALARAQEFNIPGVTYSMTQGVVKNIIPAIASTNAIIAASTTSEAFKIVTECNPIMQNYMQYSGDDGLYTYTFNYEQKEDCPVCGRESRVLILNPDITLGDFIDSLAERPDIQLKKPSLRTQDKSLFMQAPKSLREKLAPNLQKKLKELIGDEDEISVTDPAFENAFDFKIRFE
jgi:ubiquitin-activating enzyme E1 C